jgi:hypothetical protein
MKKWTLFTAAIVVSGGLLAWNAGWLPMQKSNENLAYISADTAYYFGGTSTDEIAEFVKDYPIMPSSPSQSQVWQTLLESINSDQENSPKVRFFTHLMNKYNDFSEGTMGELATFSGMSLTGSFAFYSDGIVPVLRMDISNEDVFNALIEDAVQNSEWQYEWQDLGAFKARTWKLTADDKEDEAYLAISNHEGNVVITFVTNKDDLMAKQRRFGIVKPEMSLATNSTVKDLKNRYSYTDNMVGFIQFDQIAQAILSPESNSLGRDLITYLPQDQFAQFQNSITAECKTEYGQLADSMPRFVMGYQSFGINDNSIVFDMHSAFELTNMSVITELQKMQGHLPMHSTTSKDKIFAMGVAVDADNIGPAVTALWTQLTTTEYNCSELQMVQYMAREQNPAMLGMMTAMAQGVKGVGVSLFDITMSENGPLPQGIDFIASIATENPATLLNMAKMLPFFADLNLSDDGTPALLNLPMLPPTIELKAAIKGKHLVVFSGEQSEQVANEQSSESIDSNGLLSMAFNYREISQLITSKTFNSLSSNMGGVDTCTQQYEMAHMFSSLQMDMSMVTSVETDGLVTKYAGSMDKPLAVSNEIAGKYRVEYMDENCEWTGTTVDDLKADGTGYYESKSDNNSCNLYESNYTWAKKGNTLELNGSDQIRDTCDQEFNEATQETYTCHLINVKADSFQCLFDPATDYTSLSRYTRM